MSPKDLITEQEVYFDSLMMGEVERRDENREKSN